MTKDEIKELHRKMTDEDIIELLRQAGEFCSFENDMKDVWYNAADFVRISIHCLKAQKLNDMPEIKWPYGN